MSATARFLLDESARYLRDVHLPRLERAVQLLRPEDLWWRPHEGALSVGNILLHLEGNVRQWILSGLGGEPDHRRRSAEFRAQDGPGAAELLERLRSTVHAAGASIEALDPADIGEERRIQGMSTSAQAAVLHVVEHFSWHTGQAVWIAKARAGQGHGLAFYDDAALDQARNE
jgi:uncharacterized damage-inducible protein DinB